MVKCLAESGGRYRLPVSNVSVIEKQAEWAVAEAKVQADRDASMKQIMLNHQLEGHMLTPPKGWLRVGVGHVTQRLRNTGMVKENCHFT